MLKYIEQRVYRLWTSCIARYNEFDFPYRTREANISDITKKRKPGLQPANNSYLFVVPISSRDRVHFSNFPGAICFLNRGHRKTRGVRHLQAETSRPSLVQIPEFFLIGPFGFKGTLLLEEKITVSQRVRKNLKCFISFWDENFTKLLYIIFVRIQKILLIIIFKNVLVLKHNFQIFLNRFLTDNIWREFVQWRHLLVHRSKEGHVVWSMLKRQCDKIFGCFSSISTWLCSYSSCYTIKVCITCHFFNPCRTSNRSIIVVTIVRNAALFVASL